LTEALRLRPSYAEAHFNLAEALRPDQPSGAIEQYKAALELRPDWLPCLVRLSLTLSAHRDPAVRNATEAVRLAERAVALTRRSDPDALEALAAAYASAGQFDRAVVEETAAFELLDGQPVAWRNESTARLANYRSGRLYIDGAP
jgi:spermidine synthase